jgi:hypothetical protein
MFSSINFKLSVKVAHGLTLSWLVLRVDKLWPSWLAPGSKMVCPKIKFWNRRNSSYSISYESTWWVLSRSVKILTLWRNLMTLCTCSPLSQCMPECRDLSQCMPEWGTWVNACPNGEHESMHARMGNMSQCIRHSCPENLSSQLPFKNTFNVL